MKPGTFICNLTHYLDEKGSFNHLPLPALRIALFLSSIVGWVSGRLVEGPERTNVPCRRSRARIPCLGEIEAEILEDTFEIAWRCPVCGDNGFISNWQDTRWDRSSDAIEVKSKPYLPPTRESQTPPSVH
jgi:hypothetical protein